MPASQGNKWGLYPQEVKLQGVSGRYLSGHARKLRLNRFTINNVGWDWQALSLLLGQLSLDLQVNDSNIKGRGTVARSLLGELLVSDTHLTFNSELLNPYLPKGNTLTGNIDVDVESISFDQQLKSVFANAKVDSLVISSILGRFPVEHISFEVSGNNSDGFKIYIADFINTDAVKLLVDIKHENISLSGSVKADSDLAKHLKTLLPLLGKKKGGNWQLIWTGKIPKL